jgi:hypothetical protein
MILNIKNWVVGKIIKPAIPVIKQSIYVLDIVAAKIDDSLKALSTLGIQIDGTILNNIQNVLSAVSVVKAALIRVLEFLGEKGFNVQNTESLVNVDLNKEIEKLKELI